MSTNDDAQIGTLLSRREALGTLGAAGFALFSGTPTPPGLTEIGPCVVRPAQEEGPYFVDERLNRSDIRRDPTTRVVSAGVPLLLTFRVSALSRGHCAALVGADVDIWHCDALGVYSDEVDPRAGFDARGKQFLRGFQRTNGAGSARFTTIYPGWYSGRAVHIHFKIRHATAAGGHSDFTSQLYFNDTLSDRVHAKAPYAQQGKGRLPNASDDIFREQQGDRLVLNTTRRGGGYAALFDIALALP
ncbi:MAG: intradiol ring-cleavage dioxygenase [Gemmatimonadota bacterium]